MINICAKMELTNDNYLLFCYQQTTVLANGVPMNSLATNIIDDFTPPWAKDSSAALLEWVKENSADSSRVMPTGHSVTTQDGSEAHAYLLKESYVQFGPFKSRKELWYFDDNDQLI